MKVDNQVLGTLPKLIFANFEDAFIRSAADVVEKLLEDEQFFFQTFGTVLGEIGREYGLVVTETVLRTVHEEIQQCTIVLGGIQSSRSVYMECIPKVKSVGINTAVDRFIPFEYQDRLY